jgi:hypothetical protein
MDVAAMPRTHTKNTTARPSFHIHETCSLTSAGTGIATMIRVAKMFKMPRYLHNDSPAIAQLHGP